MSYNITGSRVASEVRSDLSRLVTDAKRTASPDEYSLVELAGQIVHVALQDVPDDDLVELQAYGSNVPSQGNRVFFVSVNARPIKTKAPEKAAAAETPWTPDQGPLALRPTPGSVDPAAAATPASPATPKGTNGV